MNLLDNPDYFHCERTHCDMRKTACVTRQKDGLRHRHNRAYSEKPEECQNCPQGLEIREEMKNMPLTSEEKDRRKKVGMQVVRARGDMRAKSVAEAAGIDYRRLSHIELGKVDAGADELQKIFSAIDHLNLQEVVKESSSSNGNGLVMIAEEELKTYQFRDATCNERDATICFKNGKFFRCDFNVSCMPYDAEDWYFLGAVAEKIRELETLNQKVKEVA